MTDIIEIDGVMFDEGKIRHYIGMVDQYDYERQVYKEQLQWKPIETAPINRKVMVGYVNQYKHKRIICAEYIPMFTLLAEEGNDWAEYNEYDDEYYVPEGWYECIDNWGDFSSVAITEGVPEVWMDIPEWRQE